MASKLIRLISRISGFKFQDDSSGDARHFLSQNSLLKWGRAVVVRKAPEWKSEERIRDKLDAKKKCWMGMATPSFSLFLL